MTAGVSRSEPTPQDHRAIAGGARLTAVVRLRSLDVLADMYGTGSNSENSGVQRMRCKKTADGYLIYWGGRWVFRAYSNREVVALMVWLHERAAGYTAKTVT